MLEEKKHQNFYWHYKVSIFFILTYWVMDPILYFHFGNAYISGATDENKWLVFLAGPFSFSEDFKVNTTLSQALLNSSISPNFWFPLLTIFFAERVIGNRFHLGSLNITVGRSYFYGVLASYINAAFFWTTPLLHSPPPGTSIIAFTLILTYFALYPIVAAKELRRSGAEVSPIIDNALKAAAFGVILYSLWDFVVLNGAFLLHLFGATMYAVIYLIVRLRKTKKRSKPIKNVS